MYTAERRLRCSAGVVIGAFLPVHLQVGQPLEPRNTSAGITTGGQAALLHWDSGSCTVPFAQSAASDMVF